MSNQEQDIEIKDHEYDGIKEYDNPLPMWWLWTFYGTIIFAFIYWIHYTFGGGLTLTQELEVAMKDIKAHQVASVPAATESEADLAAIGKDAQMLEIGKQAYVGKCAACHGAELQGQIGPNLTDKYWIHGKGTHVDTIKVIREGVADKGMPPWTGILKDDELKAVTAYILSKVGSNPANAKAPQGNPIN